MKRSDLRRTALRRKPKRSRHDLVAAGAWWDAITRDAKGQTRPCAECGSKVGIQGHHLIDQQELRRTATRLRVDEQGLLWDVRGGIPTCTRCHERHTTAFLRLHHSVIPLDGLLFAHELGLDHYFDAPRYRA